VAKTLSIEEVLKVFETPPPNRGDRDAWRVYKDASVRTLIAATKAASPRARQELIYMLGRRRAKSAASLLVEYLHDDNVSLRAEAADALAKIKSARTGPAIFDRFVNGETAGGVRQLLAVALGAVRYQPALPLLIRELDSPDKMMRGCAAWSVGCLGDATLVPLMREYFVRETEPYPKERMRQAIKYFLGQESDYTRRFLNGQWRNSAPRQHSESISGVGSRI
jgi:HEAT repeat protein